MIELVLGSNHYKVTSHWQAKRDEYIAEHGPESVVILEANDSDWKDLHQAMEGVSLFGPEERLVIVRDLSQNTTLAAQLVDNIEHISSSTFLEVVDEKPDKRSSFYKAIKREGIVTEYSDLNEAEASRWIQEYVSQNDGKISSSDARFLVERIGPDQQLLQNELEKLLIHGSSIQREAIELLVEPKLQDTIFELLDAMTAGNQQKASDVYSRLIQNQMQPIYILTMIGWQLHAMLAVSLAGDMSERDIAAQAKLSPYVVGKTKRLVRRLSQAKVRQMVRSTAKTDILIKTTKTDAAEQVANLIRHLAAA